MFVVNAFLMMMYRKLPVKLLTLQCSKMTCNLYNIVKSKAGMVDHLSNHLSREKLPAKVRANGN